MNCSRLNTVVKTKPPKYSWFLAPLFPAVIGVFIANSNALAASLHKGLNFQAQIQLPSGEYPTQENVLINAKILSPNDCILRDETFTVSMIEGSISLPLGTGTTTANDKGLTLAQAMDNSKTIQSLTCVNLQGQTVVDNNDNTVTSYNPGDHPDGRRKLRLAFDIHGKPVKVEFTMRSVAYAVNAETLDGRRKEEFLQTSSQITQERLEDFLSKITSAPEQAIKWDGSRFTSYSPNFDALAPNTGKGALIVHNGTSNVSLPAGPNNYVLTADSSQPTGLKWVALSTSGDSIPSGPAGGDLGDTYPAPRVTKIQGRDVATTEPSTGQLLRWSGSEYVPVNFGFSHLLSSTGLAQFPSTPCSGAQTLTWSSTTDTFTCSLIANLNASVITEGTIDAARLPTSATAWTPGDLGSIYYSSGKVGVGTANPTSKIHLVGDYLKITDAETNSGTLRLGANFARPGLVGDKGLELGASLDTTNLDSGIAFRIRNLSLLNGVQQGTWRDRFIIFTDGRTAIGTDLTSASGLLHVQGSTISPSTGVSVPIAVFQGANGQTANLQEWRDPSGSILSVMTSGGDVGIGTSSPAGFLDVNGGKLTVLRNGRIAVGKTTARAPIDLYNEDDPANGPSNGSGILAVGGIIQMDGLQDMTTGATVTATGGALTYPLHLRDEANRWQNIAEGAALTVDIGRVMSIKAITWGTYWKNSHASDLVSYAIDYSTDGTNWQNWETVTNNTKNPVLHVLSAGTEMRYVRITNNGAAGPFISNLQILGYTKQSPYSAQEWGFLPKDGMTILARTRGGVAIGTVATAPSGGLLASGSVGIGTISPANKLSVNGSADFSGSVAIGKSTAPSYTLDVVSALGATVSVTNTANNSLATLRLSNDVSDSAILALTPSGAADGNLITIPRSSIYYTAGTGGLAIGASNAAGVLRMFTGGTALSNERLRINSTGNVGIGVTNPSYKLDVNGDINIATTNALRFGGTSVCTSAGCTSSSDERLKENISPLENALEKVLRLRGVEYDYQDKTKFEGGHQIGVIAQEVEKVFPEVVKTDKTTGLKSVAYDHLVAPMIEAIKALYGRINVIESKTALLEAENIELKDKDKKQNQKIDRLEQENAQLKARLEKIETWIQSSDSLKPMK